MKVCRAVLRAVFLVALLALVPTAVAACGGDETSDESQSIVFIASNADNGIAVTGPPTAESGRTEISLNNESEKAADLQLLRVEGDHSADEVAAALTGATRGQPLPDWFFAGGGVGLTGPGESQTVTQILEPGTYYAFDTNSRTTSPELGSELTVSGDPSDQTLEADATVSAFEYDFKADGLTTGDNEVLFENTGSQPHHVIYAPIVGDATRSEIEKAIREDQAQPPIDLENERATAVLDSGGRQLVDLDFAEPGRYALLCFVSDRQGGPPHAFKGMIAEVDVE